MRPKKKIKRGPPRHLKAIQRCQAVLEQARKARRAYLEEQQEDFYPVSYELRERIKHLRTMGFSIAEIAVLTEQGAVRVEKILDEII